MQNLNIGEQRDIFETALYCKFAAFNQFERIQNFLIVDVLEKNFLFQLHSAAILLYSRGTFWGRKAFFLNKNLK